VDSTAGPIKLILDKKYWLNNNPLAYLHRIIKVYNIIIGLIIPNAVLR
jgi:hypothetical protein